MRHTAMSLAACLALLSCKDRGSSRLAGDEGDASFANLAFDVNDLSILFPLAGSTPYPAIKLDAQNLQALGIRELWPKATAFDPMLAFARGETVGGRLIGAYRRDGVDKRDEAAVIPFSEDGTHEFVADQTRWRVVSMRFDPCARADQAHCEVEMRLIAQPFDADDFDVDASAHLLYHLGTLDVATGEFVASSTPAGLTATFRELVADLQQIKALTKAAGATTDGTPLGFHPGLATEAINGGPLGSIGGAVARLIDKCAAAGLSAVTSVITVDASPWVFFQGQVANGSWTPTTITGANDQFSIRKLPVIGSSQGKVFPEPLTHPSTAERFNHDVVDQKRDYLIENPGHYGEAHDKLSVVNLDCVSCHSTNAANGPNAASAAGFLDALYVPEPGITGYRASGIVPSATRLWNFRAFGLFGNVPSVVDRMVNEAAEAARFANQKLLPTIYGRPFKNPGLVCKTADQAPQPETHAALLDCLKFLDHTFEQCRAMVCVGG